MSECGQQQDFSRGTVHIVIMGCVPWQLNASDSLKEGNQWASKVTTPPTTWQSTFLSHDICRKECLALEDKQTVSSIGIQMLFGSTWRSESILQTAHYS